MLIQTKISKSRLIKYIIRIKITKSKIVIIRFSNIFLSDLVAFNYVYMFI